MKLVAGAAIAILILLGVVGAFLLRSGDKAADTSQATTQPARPATAGEPAATAPDGGKITDRVGAETPAEPSTAQAQPPADPVPSEPIPLAPADPAPSASGAAEPLAPAGAAGTGSEDLAAVAQRASLFEEDPENPQRGRSFDGNVTWRTESVSTSASAPLETAIRGQIDIPERKIKVQVTIRRNTDPALPASHTVELQFVVPADFPNGGVQNVPGILMKDGQAQRGLPLSGLSVKVTNGFFLVGLNDPPAEAGRNSQLLRERSWIDLPILYENGRRAILSIEKGVPGEKAFEDAFAAWAAAQ